MGIKAHFKGNIDAAFNRFLAAIDEEIIDRLCRIGEEVVTYAKQIPPERGFTDRTGNLRSSIGYVICKDGQPINLAFEAVKGGHEGVHTGQRLAMEIAGKHPEGYTLIVVAGMNYAAYVESKGRDVLTSAETEAGKLLEKHMADMVANIQDAFR